jgi:hypothetical protein
VVDLQHPGGCVVGFLCKGGGVIAKWQPYKEFLWVQTLTHQALAVFIVSPLWQRWVQLDCATFNVKVRDVLAPCPLPDYAYAVTSVDGVTNTNYGVKQMSELRFKDVDWTLEAVRDHLPNPLVGPDDDYPAPRTVHSSSRDDARKYGTDWITKIGVTPGCEIEVHSPVIFSVSLKVRGVEKARIDAKSTPRS